MKKNDHPKVIAILILIILLIISFFLSFTINLGGILILLLIICGVIYRLSEDATSRKLEPFETWTSIHLEEKKETLSEIDDKLEEINNEDYDFTKDNYVSHSKEELIKELKEQKKITEDRIKKLEKAFMAADEDIPE